MPAANFSSRHLRVFPDDVASNSELTELHCQDNKLTTLPYYPELTEINLTGNSIAELMADPTDVAETFAHLLRPPL